MATESGYLPPPLLEARNVTKRYGNLVANNAVNLGFSSGEVHALLGENGAGKTTLMRMAYGLEQPDEGWFEIDGERVDIASPRVALDSGIGMVHQHFMLVPTMTVAENVVLGHEPPNRSGRFATRSVETKVGEFAEARGLSIDPRRVVGDLTVGEQQRVEILRTLYRGARIVALDEPTAVLTAQETDRLFEVLGALRSQGTAIVLITHKMREIMAIADRISVLRHGNLIGSVDRAGAQTEALVSMMVGRAVDLERVKQPRIPAASCVELADVSVDDGRGGWALDSISLSIGVGEIVGIAGVDGNGQAELVGVLSGMTPVSKGRVVVDGRPLTGKVRSALKRGIRYIAEDRHRRGLVLPFSVAENLSLRRYRGKPLSRWGWLFPARVRTFAGRLLEEYDVRGPELDTAVAALSGGNQQKIVIARELEMSPTVLIAAQPTRGLDVGAIEFVHGQLLRQQDAGCAILLVSFELDELRALADRILVLYGGRVVGEFPPSATDKELGRAMAGMSEEAA